MSDYIIVVAGGRGLRMGSDVPKQFLPVGGKPVLMHTLERFRAYSESLNIILVLPREQQEYWKTLCKEHDFQVEHTIADGGDTRFQSSKNGLALIPDNADGVVGIHDGVRPFVSLDVIDRCFEAAREDYAAIPVMPVTDTLRFVDDHGGGRNVQRSDYRIVQTPQTFDISLAKQAFNQPYRDAFTDDASVVESLGCQVSMVEGNRENIKITTPFDLIVAEALLKERENKG
ncbi:MAG: 2-C-methyl-D-erythritol 4-phosphate cytidylyltransferase [Prevotella sp.]|nr:2-C-methyl-D-erythritol 4-phosphate cytidylyltransferase [Prevotella sp.]